MPPQDPTHASGDWSPSRDPTHDIGNDINNENVDGTHVPYHGRLSHLPHVINNNNDNNNRNRNRNKRSSSSFSFMVEFCQLEGPPQIASLMVLVALGLGSTIGIVPSLMTDRFAQLRHGLSNNNSCSSYHAMEDRPHACALGNADAQAAASASSFVNNVLTFATASLIGSLSDEWGRKGPLLVGLVVSTIPMACLTAMMYLPNMSPWWYYGTSAASGAIPWLAIALSALNDVLPPHLRAPGTGLLFAGFLLGMCVSPTLGLLVDRKTLCHLSVCVLLLGVVGSVRWIPETLPEHEAETARLRRLQREEREDATDREKLGALLLLREPLVVVEDDDNNNDNDNDNDNNNDNDNDDRDSSMAVPVSRGFRRRFGFGSESVTAGWHRFWWGHGSAGTAIRRFAVRPVRELSILNRDCVFRLLAALALFSGMVQSGDQVLLIYFLEEQLDFDTGDVSLMFLVMGTVGILVQVVLMKPLNDRVGEKNVVALAFAAGAIDNVLYGTANRKTTIFVALAISGFSTMSFPTISAIKANNAADFEQGRIQGALYSVKALASGVGPAVLQLVYSKTRDRPRGGWCGPGTMFVFAGMLFVVAVGLALALPSERANADRHNNSNNNSNGHRDENQYQTRDIDMDPAYTPAGSDDIDNNDDDDDDEQLPRLGEYMQLAAASDEEEGDEEQTYGSI